MKSTTTTFPLNAWYAAAYDVELGRQLLPRTICNQKLVLYRRLDGQAVALHDACWHRLLPLSQGRLQGDDVVCGYHGLVYNPQGPSLPPAQGPLQADYRKHLGEKFGIQFSELFVLTNMPIQRFGSTLISKGQFTHYMDVLKNAYQPANLESVMCRSLLSVDYLGYVYDCDFNQMLGLPLRIAGQPKPRLTLAELAKRDLAGEAIAVKDHCFGCSAGQGSSCGGALAA
mgnify:CR=1 FL=1